MTQQDERETLREQLKSKPYLLIDCDASEARLANFDEMRAKIADGIHFIMYVQGAVDDLSKLTDEQDQFSLTEIAKIAGVEYHAAHFWLREGVLPASIRARQGSGRGRGPIFSFRDAVAAGILGTLRRQGIALETAQVVVPLFAEGQQKEKRTARKPTTSGRS